MVGSTKLTLRSDEAGEAPELMPGAAAEFLDDEREFPDGEDAEDAARLCPDYAAAATAEQLTGSEGHIILGTHPVSYMLSDA